MASVRIEIEGAKQIQSLLERLPKRISKRVRIQAMKHSLKDMRKDARSNVEIRSGQLRRSIGIWRRTRNVRQGEVEVHLGTRTHGKYKGYHGHLVEFGTEHSAEDPFLRPAWNKNRIKAIKEYRAEILNRIEYHAKRMAKTGRV